jgi:hypothetical protein
MYSIGCRTRMEDYIPRPTLFVLVLHNLVKRDSEKVWSVASTVHHHALQHARIESSQAVTCVDNHNVIFQVYNFGIQTELHILRACGSWKVRGNLYGDLYGGILATQSQLCFWTLLSPHQHASECLGPHIAEGRESSCVTQSHSWGHKPIHLACSPAWKRYTAR